MAISKHSGITQIEYSTDGATYTQINPMKNDKKKPNIFQRISAWLAGMIGAWINQHSGTTAGILAMNDEAQRIEGRVEAAFECIDRLTDWVIGREKELNILQGKVRALLWITGATKLTSRWDELGTLRIKPKGSEPGIPNISDKTLSKWQESTGLRQWQVLIEKNQNSLLNTLEESMSQLHKSQHKVAAMAHLLKLQLQENGNPANVEAWRSLRFHQDARVLMALEASLGIEPEFNDTGEFVAYQVFDPAQKSFPQGSLTGRPVVQRLEDYWKEMQDLRSELLA